jgi:ubiquinone/menaquinone biosynthesis C-methylase UbiE
VSQETDGNVKSTLQSIDVHRTWSSGFRTAENEPFYQQAFDYLATVYGAPGDEPILDAGCGSGTKSVHLSARGYSVVGVDFSQAILDVAMRSIAAQKLSDRITLQKADLTDLTFGDASFGRVLCWGVLMHIPAVDKAVAEVVRVTRPGGSIIVSERNHYGIESIALRVLKHLLRRQHARVCDTPAGLEFWDDTPSGTLMTRQANIAWLIRQFAAHGADLVVRRSGQFSEPFVSIPWKPLRFAVHAFNGFWFRWTPWAAPACANLLVFRQGVG